MPTSAASSTPTCAPRTCCWIGRGARLAPRQESDRSVGLKHTEWAFRSALRGAPPEDPWATAPGPATRGRGSGWGLHSLAVALPLVATLVVVVVLTGLFDFLPPVV